MHALYLAPLLLVPLNDQPDDKRRYTEAHVERAWRLHAWLGEAAFADGKLDTAERELTVADDLVARPATIFLLAEVRLARGKYLQVEQLCQKLHPRLALKYGAESAEVARCLTLHARASAALGLRDDALYQSRLATTIHEKQLPKDHPDLLGAARAMSALWYAGALTPLIVSGLPIYPEARRVNDFLDKFEATLSADDPRRADCLLIRGRMGARVWPELAPTAERQLNGAIQLLIARHGSKHPALADCWTELARVYGIQGKLDLALEAQENAFAVLREHYGRLHPRWAWALANMSEIQRALGHNAESAKLLEEASRAHFCALTDLELCAACARNDQGHVPTEYLLELVRRKGPVVVKFLEQKYDEFLDVQRRANDIGRSRRSSVALLTALRRAQGKPDPLPIVVNGPDEMESIFPNLPTLDAALVNRDFQKKRITFTDGGDYRSGRQDRWRLNVRDSKGNIIPVKAYEGIIEGGGLSHMGVLKSGESWDTVIPMRKFIELPPGDYTVTVEYHDDLTISGYAHTAGLLVCRSEPFKLHVQPRVIDVTKKDREAAKAAVAALGDKGPVFVLDGTYGKDDHDFIKPDSAAGKLLALGWRAVPALLDELDRDLTPQRRAWVFAMLFSITSWNDPYPVSGVLGECKLRGRGWAVSGGRNGKVYAMGLGSSSGVMVLRSDQLDEAAQKEFATKWKTARDYIVVREKP